MADAKTCFRCRRQVPIVCLVLDCPHEKAAMELITQKKAENDYDTYDDDECANCGGEGIVYMCHQEFACIDPEGGCDECARRCDWCRPRKPPANPSADGEG